MLKLPHLASCIFDTPLMIEPAKLEQIIHVLSPRFMGQVQTLESRGNRTARKSLQIAYGVAIIPVYGTLTQRSSGVDADSGLLSYHTLQEQIASALEDPQVMAIMLDIDSGGGMVAGNFDFVDWLFSMRGQKPIWAIANEIAASAAYSIASAAEQVWMTRTALVGSVGVINAHIDQSGYDEKQGLKWTLMYAGDRKIEQNPHEPLSESAKQGIQARVDRTYRIFTQTVARHRNMSVSAVVDTQAGIFTAEDALAVGFVDAIGSFDEAMTALVGEITNPGSSRMTARSVKPRITAQQDQLPAAAVMLETPLSNQQRTEIMTTNQNNTTETTITSPEAAAVTPAVIPSPAAASPSQNEAVMQAEAKAKMAERDRVLAIMATANKLNIAGDFAQTLVMEGVTAEAANTRMIDHMATASATSSIVGSNGNEAAPDLSNLPVEERTKAEWAKTPKLRAEFGDRYESYLAFERAKEKGSVRIKKTD